MAEEFNLREHPEQQASVAMLMRAEVPLEWRYDDANATWYTYTPENYGPDNQRNAIARKMSAGRWNGVSRWRIKR